MAKLHQVSGSVYKFYCPGCKTSHLFDANVWKFDDEMDNPTVSPSILVQNGHFVSADKCWCKFNAERIARGEEPSGFECFRCHVYLTDGKIQFLNDCSHELAGQIVPLPDWQPQ